MHDLSVVVVTWRSPDLLRRCLQSVVTGLAAAEVVVVDNASGDSTPEMVRRDFPSVRLLPLDSNLGLAAGLNRGLAASRGADVLIINPDVEIASAPVAALRQTLAANPGAAAVGGHLVDAGGRPQARYAPCPFPGVGRLARQVLLPGAAPPPPPAAGGPPLEVDQVAGACVLLRRTAVEGIGGYDERFHPIWFEDVDLCLRLRQAGHTVLHHPGAPFVHLGGGSAQRLAARDYYAAWYDNLLRYAHKHQGAGAALFLRALTVPGAILRLAGTLLTGRPSTPFGRGAQAAAMARVASRSLLRWPGSSRFTS